MTGSILSPLPPPDDAQIVEPRITRVRYQVLAALSGLAAFTYLDRVCISLAAPWIIRDLHLGALQMGFIFSAFAAAYAVFEIPTGWLGDRLGARRVLTRVLAWWSVFTATTGWTQGFTGLISVRFLFGAGEAGAYPNMTRAVAAWFPERRRGMAMGTIWTASRLGGAITPPIVLFLIDHVGWRSTFQLLGLSGLLLAALWYSWFRDHPAEKRTVSPAELRWIGAEEGPTAAHAGVPWKSIASSTNLWSLNLMYFTLGFTYYLYISWFPIYLVRYRHIASSCLATYASMPLVFSTVAAISGGLVTDRLVSRLGLRWGRRLVGMAGCAGAAACLAGGILMTSTLVSVLLVSMAAAASDFVLAASWACCADIGGAATGTVSGAMNMTGNVGAALSPALMGLLIEKTASWNLTFLIAAGLNLAGMLLWLFIQADRKLQPRPGAAQ